MRRDRCHGRAARERQQRPPLPRIWRKLLVAAGARRKLSLEQIRTTVRRLQSQGLHVLLIGQSPVFSFAYPDEYFYAAFREARGARNPESFFEAPVDPEHGVNRDLQRLVGSAATRIGRSA
jgi:hypothetical protein